MAEMVVKYGGCREVYKQPIWPTMNNHNSLANFDDGRGLEYRTNHYMILLRVYIYMDKLKSSSNEIVYWMFLTLFFFSSRPTRLGW